VEEINTYNTLILIAVEEYRRRKGQESAIEKMIYHMGPKDVQAFDK